MSKMVIDMSEFIHLKGEPVYNHNYYKHKEYGYTILEVCEELLCSLALTLDV